MHWYPLYLTSDPKKTAFCCLKSILAFHHYYHDWKWIEEDLGDHDWDIEGMIHLLERYEIDYTSFTSLEEAIENKSSPIIVNIGQQCILIMKMTAKSIYIMDPMRGYRKLSISMIKSLLVLQCFRIGFIGRYAYRHDHLWPFCLRNKKLNLLLIIYFGLNILFVFISEIYGFIVDGWLDIVQLFGGVIFLWMMAKKLACKTEDWQREWPFLKKDWINQTYWQCLSFYMQLLWCGWLLECFLFATSIWFIIIFQMFLLGGVSHVLRCCYLPDHFDGANTCLYRKNKWNYFGLLLMLCVCHILFIIFCFQQLVSWSIIRALLYFGMTALCGHIFSLQFHYWREQIAFLQFVIEKHQISQPLEMIDEITFCQVHDVITLQRSGGLSDDVLYHSIIALGSYTKLKQWDVYLNGYSIIRYTKSDYLDKVRYYASFVWKEKLALRTYLGDAGTKIAWQYQLLTVELLTNQQICSMSVEAKEIAAFVYHYLIDNLLDIYIHCLDHISDESLKKLIKLIEQENKKWVILLHPRIKLVNPSFEYAIMMHEEGGS